MTVIVMSLVGFALGVAGGWHLKSGELHKQFVSYERVRAQVIDDLAAAVKEVSKKG